MKRFTQSVLFLFLLTITIHSASAEEFVLVDATISYTMSSNNAFVYKQITPEMPDNWISPNNYYIGQIYQRYEVIDVATDAPFAMQFGIWQYRYDSVGNILNGKDGEIVGPQLFLSGTGATVEDNSIPNTNTWYKIRGGVDFTKMTQSDIHYMGFVIWAPDPMEPISPYKSVDTTFSGIHWTEREKWFPVTIKVTVVAVSYGSAFSGWENYVGVKPATPSYAIDYDSVRTTTAISASDEYSYTETMDITFAGGDSVLQLSPGQDVYFRTPAVGYNPESDIQHLVVPARPGEPEFTIDYALEQTNEIVSTSTEYSASADMSAAISGTNALLDLVPGQDVYFRKKASGSSFQSPVFHLMLANKPAAPSVSIDYAAESTNEILPSSVEYSVNSDMSSSTAGANAKLVINPGNDLYFRVASTSGNFASDITALPVLDRPGTPAISIDYLNEMSSVVGSDMEYSVNADMSFAEMGTDQMLALTPGTDLFIRVKSTAGTFASAIQELDVVERPITPNYTVNFLAEQTNEPVSSADNYSGNPNMTGAVPGTDSRLALTPGNNVYFQTPATAATFNSQIQTIAVPARPETPVYTIDYANEATVEFVSEQVIVSKKMDMSNPQAGTNNVFPVLPNDNLFFQVAYTASSFMSGISEIKAPGRNFLGYSGSDTLEGEKIVCYAVLKDAGINFDLSYVEIENGTASNLRSGNAFDVHPSGTGEVKVSIPANTITNDSYASNTISVYFSNILSLSSMNSSNTIETYPQPSINGNITIKSNYGNIDKIEVFNLKGGKMLEYEELNDSMAQINIGNLPAGTYILRVTTTKEIITRKIIR